MGIVLEFRRSNALHSAAVFALVCLGIFSSTSVLAKASLLCPSLSATVANAGVVTINVSACDGPFDGGMSGPIRPYAQHGLVTIGKNSRNVQRVTYKHKGNAATSDVFYLEDNDNGVVRVNITILKAKSRKS
jgi:large repetitive protein